MRTSEFLIKAALVVFGSAALASCASPSQVRHEEMIATAQSLDASGIDGLVNNGFPKIATTSQRSLNIGWAYDFSTGGGDLQHSSFYAGCGATVLNAPELAGHFLINATHCSSPEHEANSLLKGIQSNNPGAQVSVENVQVTDIQFDNLDLRRDQVGIASLIDTGVESSPVDSDGISLIFVPDSVLNTLDPNMVPQLNATALNVGDLWLEPTPPGVTFDVFCTPGELNGKPTVIVNAGVVKEDSNEIIFGPGFAGPGCSGSGDFMKTPDGKSHLAAVTIGIWGGDRNDQTGSYKLSTLGVDGLRQLIGNAYNDYLARQGN